MIAVPEAATYPMPVEDLGYVDADMFHDQEMLEMDAVPDSLSAKYKESFAYGTIRDRLPVILTKIADTVYRSKSFIKERYGQNAQEDLKFIVGCMSKLRNEVQTNKPVIPIQDNRADSKVWNEYLTKVTDKYGEAPCWFISPWLYVECYMYRRIQEAVERRHMVLKLQFYLSPTTHCEIQKLCVYCLEEVVIGRENQILFAELQISSCLQMFDVFAEQKEKALQDSTEAVLRLLNYLMTVVEDLNEGKEVDVHKLFIQIVQVSLWGNKCDLSISAGMDNAQKSCPLDQVNILREYILIDDLEQAWSKLREKEPSRVDIVLDNAGFEFVTDLCLAEFLISAKLANCVHFHAKSFPWFVSDVTKTDLDHTFQLFQQSNSLAMNRFTSKWKERFQEGSWTFKAHDFWTMPFDYSDMREYALDLYEDLEKSSLIFFKGDLNYRKLVGDRRWPTTTPFTDSLRGFCPAPLLSLRTLKADVVTGLKEGQADEVGQKDDNWMISGNWAVMAFSSRVK